MSLLLSICEKTRFVITLWLFVCWRSPPPLKENIDQETIVIEDTPSSSTPGDVYCQIGFGIIGSRDYLTLKRGEKISDEIINGMLHHQMRDRMDCYMFNSHFMSNYN